MMMRLAQDNSIMDNIDYKAKVGFVPAGDGGRVTIVLSFASESPSLLGAEVPVYARVHPISAIFPSQRRRIVPGPQACGAKNALVKDVPAKSGAEASDEGILKKDLAAAEAPAAGTVDSDKAKATSLLGAKVRVRTPGLSSSLSRLRVLDDTARNLDLECSH